MACLWRALDSLAAQKPIEHVVFLWGPGGSGRTHLLQAVCHRAQELSLSFAYLPFGEITSFTPTVLDGFESAPLVCLDDLQSIAGVRAWEEAVFALVERLRARAGLLVVAADAPPAQLKIMLPDLVTRLGWGPVYPLQPLADDEKLAALQLRASRLGFELPDEVARYVLARYPRDTGSLFAWLDRIDRQAFIAQRRLTIPFVRELEKT